MGLVGILSFLNPKIFYQPTKDILPTNKGYFTNQEKGYFTNQEAILFNILLIQKYRETSLFLCFYCNCHIYNRAKC